MRKPVMRKRRFPTLPTMPISIPMPTILILVCAMAHAAAVWAAELEVQLDRNRLRPDETLTLRLIADGSASGEPDFAPLTAHFEILGQGQSQTTRIVNGTLSQTRQWTLELAPKRTGTLVIPPLAVGRAHSQSVTVEVAETLGKTPDEESKPLFVKGDVEIATPYVQQPVDYRVRVYFRAKPQRATLSDPVVEGATLARVGTDRNGEEWIDGRRYDVIERHYLVIPQRSGALRIEGPRLEAMIPDPQAGNRRDPFADLDEAFGGTFFPGLSDRSHSGRRAVAQADPLTLQVQAQPAEFDAPWLPATSVQIAEEWTPSQPTFRVGEPLTRTLTLTAQGVTAAQLPTLQPGTPDGIQVYADQPQSEDLSGAAVPTAIKRVKLALVPTRAGTFALPEIRLPWWDTVADTPRVAVVPARTVTVAGAPLAAGQPPARVADRMKTEPPPEPEPKPVPASSPRQFWPQSGSAGLWPQLASLLGLAWLGTLIWWWRDRRSRRASGKAPDPQRTAPDRYALARRAARRQIERACGAGDARATRDALVAWARLRWPDRSPQGLGELGRRLDDAEIETLLGALDRAIYAPPGAIWDGATLWRALAPKLDGTASAVASPETLPELYPPV